MSRNWSAPIALSEWPSAVASCLSLTMQAKSSAGSLPNRKGLVPQPGAVDDADEEPTEVAILRLTAACSCGCGCTCWYELDAKDGDATITVADDDNDEIRVVATQEDLNEMEGEEGTFLITCFLGVQETVYVSYDFGFSTAAADIDYTLSGPSENPLPMDGNRSTAQFTAKSLNDAADEGAESIIFTLLGAFSCSTTYPLGLESTATTTIDDDDNWTISVEASPNTPLVEASGDTGTFKIVRSGGKDKGYPITVDFALSGTATYGTDYTADGMQGSGAFCQTVILQDTQEVSLAVYPQNDSLKEPDEEIKLQISGAWTDACGVCGGNCCGAFFQFDTGKKTITIADDDHWKVRVTAVDDVAREPGAPLKDNPGSFKIERVPDKVVPYPMDKSYPVDVDFVLSGSASPPVLSLNPDYELQVGSQLLYDRATIPSNATVTMVDLIVQADPTPEPEELARLMIMAGPGTPAPYTIDGLAGLATAKIQDNDWTVSVEAPDSSAAEQSTEEGWFRITRTRQRPQRPPLTFEFEIPHGHKMDSPYEWRATANVHPKHVR